MEPKIKMDSNISIHFNGYQTCLSNKIKAVCSKIGISYKGITWIIFDPAISDIYGNIPDNLQKIFIGRKGSDYGATNGIDTIWISTLSISRDFSSFYTLKKLQQTIGFLPTNDEDFLAEVIIDELTHIATGCDHGTATYDKKYVEFLNVYYRKNAIGILQKSFQLNHTL